VPQIVWFERVRSLTLPAFSSPMTTAAPTHCPSRCRILDLQIMVHPLVRLSRPDPRYAIEKPDDAQPLHGGAADISAWMANGL
jgi:hypothetical protein